MAGVVLAAGAGGFVYGGEGGEVGGGEVIGKAAQGVGGEQSGGVGGFGDDGDGGAAQDAGTRRGHGERPDPCGTGGIVAGEVVRGKSEQQLGGETAQA